MPARCPTPNKRRYLSRTGALRVRERLRAVGTFGSDDLRVYRCVRGHWHLTSGTPRRNPTSRTGGT